MDVLAGLIIGAHIATAHFGAAPDTRLQDRNPGAYARLAGGATFGAYRNSIGRSSVYAGWTWTHGAFSVTAGGVTGYEGRRIQPLLVPSVAAGPIRLTYLPNSRRGGPQGLHLSVETKL